MSRLPGLMIFGAALLGLVGVAALILASPRQRGNSVFQRAGDEAVAAAAGAELSRPKTEDDYLRELELLNVTDKPAALALVEAGEHWYAPTGEAAEQRRALRVTLLVDLDRVDEARQRAREFVSEFPESKYLPRLQPIAEPTAAPSR